MRYIKIYGMLVIVLIFFRAGGTAGANSGVTYYYSIHNGSYSSEKNAGLYAASVEKMGVPAFTEKIEIPGKGVWYRVYIGRYVSLRSAQSAVISLKNKNIEDLGSIKRFPAADPKRLMPVDTKALKGMPRSVAGKAPSKPKVEELTSPKTKAEALKYPEITADKEKVPEKDSPFSGGDVRKEPTAANPVLDKADRAFREGRFSETIDLLDNFITQGHPDKRSAEAADRLIAESWYNIGIKGDSQALLKAVDHYKTVLNRYPDPAVGNDSAYCNMSKSYEKLSFFYEAADAWEGIVLSYPESPCFEEALFRSGYVLFPTGKNEKIYEKLNRYIKKYPNGAFAKKAYYALGDSLYRMRSFDQAAKWFDSARKKWPDLSDVPENMLDIMGNCYFNMARYDDAFRVCSFLASLHPHDDFGKNAFFIMAQAADNNGYDDLAVKLYGMIAKKYPKSRETGECELALANLGVKNPGLKVSANIWQIDSYLNPLQTYEKILAKGETGDRERVMFWKGKALEKNGDIRGALDNYTEMLNKYPRGRFIKEVSQNLKNVIVAFIDLHYAQSNYPVVADLYFKLRRKVPLSEDFGTGFKIGRSLQQIGLYREAGDIYGKLRGVRKAGNDDDLLIALIEVDIALKDSVAAEDKLRLVAGKNLKNDNKMMQNAMKKLADLYLESGNFEKAAVLYAKVIEQGTQEDAALFLNYGRCLEAKKLTAEAEKSFLTALKYCESNRENCENSVLSRIYAGMGDVYGGEKKFDKGVEMYRKALEYASDKESKRWLMLQIGKAYGSMDNFGAAERNFSQIKEVPDGDFWPGVADFFISQGARTQDSGGQQ